MYILEAHYCRGHKNWRVNEKFESIDKAEKMAQEVLNDPYPLDDLYDLAICDHKGLIIKHYNLQTEK